MKFIRKNWEILALTAILVAAFLIRFTGLSDFPAGFHADEASHGYDAYSILKTGRDQWGSPMPLAFKSFGDYKGPLYGYIDVIFVAIFGLTKFATRVPGPILGTLAVFAVYLLAGKIFESKKSGIAAAFFLAINPWAIMLSRGAFESNLITFLAPMGIYLFLKGVEKPKFFLWSSLAFGLALFSYQASKLIIPSIIIGLTVIYFNKLKDLGWKKIFAPLLLFLIFFTGMLYTFVIGGGQRVAERSITQGALEEGAREKISAINSGVNPTLARIEHNKYQVAVSRFINNYFQYFSPKFYFTKGAGEPTYGMVPGIGVLNIFEGVLIIGLIPFFLRKSKSLTFILILWIMLGALPAALTTGIGFAGNRASGMIPAIQILEVAGILGWLTLLNNNKFVIYLSSTLLSLLIIFNFYSFINKYFINIPENFYSGMLYGDLEVGEWLKDNSGDRNVFVSRSLSEPQIFIAFSQKWDPSDYQAATKNWDLKKAGVPWVDQLPEYKLGKYTFKSIDWKKDVVKGSVVVAKPDDYPKDVKPSKIIYDPAGIAQIYVKDN